MAHSFSFERLSVLLTGVFLSSMLSAQSVRDDAVFFDKPDGNPVSVKVKAGTAVKVIKRQGFWVEVEVAGKAGWLKVSQLNFSGVTGGPTAIDTGRLGKGNIVATSAARGLSAKDLLSGQPNFSEVIKLEAQNVTQQAVQAFMVAGGLSQTTEKIQLSIPRSAASTPPVSSGAPSNTGTPSTKKKDDDDW